MKNLNLSDWKSRKVRGTALGVLLVLALLLGIWLFNKPAVQPVQHAQYRFNVKEMGAAGDASHDDTKAIQKALNRAKTSTRSIKVVVPAGTYKLTNTLHIYKNTHLVLEDGATFLRSHDDTILMNGDYGDSYSSYNGQGNITIEGGVWEGNIQNYPDSFNAIGLARGKNITIRHIEVRDIASGHAIDLNSSMNVTIENNKFLGYRDVSSNHSRYYAEAIQVAEHTKLGYSHVGKFDGTPNKHVIIRNNEFGPSGTPETTAWPVGVGNHGSVHNHFNRDIQIYDNTFNGMTFTGVRIFKWKDTLVKNNTFLNCDRGVSFSNPDGVGEASKTADGQQTSLPQSGSDAEIIGNTFKDTKQENIFAMGWPKNDTIAKINKITISNNFFQQQLSDDKPSMYLKWVNQVNISNNTFAKAYRGIDLEFASNTTISENQFEDISTDGIYVGEPDQPYQNKGYTSDVTIENNKLSNIAGVGIQLQFTDGFTVKENTIDPKSYPLQTAILARNYSQNGDISSNTIYASSFNRGKAVDVTNTCLNVKVADNRKTN